VIHFTYRWMAARGGGKGVAAGDNARAANLARRPVSAPLP
jgi:hypothetical protein